MTSRQTYLLDTSVLLSDPQALFQFDEHSVVVPVVVLTELEGKRQHEQLGWAARTALRSLEELRVKHGTLTEDVPVGDMDGTLRVEMNHQKEGLVPKALNDGSNDFRILTVAKNLASEGEHVTLVSNDLPLRLRASIIGLEAEEYRHERVAGDPWAGLVTVETAHETIDTLYQDKSIPVTSLDGHADLPANAGVVMRSGTQSAVGRVIDDQVHLIPQNQSAFDLHPRSAEQRVALDLLLDNNVGIVSVTGSAGTGKSILSLAAALELVLERRTHRKIMVFRPMHAVGGESLGYLPGTASEKIAPWAAAIHDALDALGGENVKEEVLGRKLLEVEPITFIRGRTLGPDVIVIMSEAQSWEASSLGALLSRLGEGSRAFIDWDVNQRDSIRGGKYDGVVSLVNRLAGNPLFGHVALKRQERSPVAELAAAFLEGAS